MDVNYWYALAAFAVGCLAGFQPIYEKFRFNAASAAATFPGAVYLLLRGLVPAAFFCLLYSLGRLQRVLWLEALGIGFGTEAFLRSAFYVKATPKGLGTEDVLRGPFELMRLYQNFFFERIYTRGGRKKYDFVHSNLPRGKSFTAVCRLVCTNAEMFPPGSGLKKLVIDAVSESQDEYEKTRHAKGDTDLATIDSEYIEKLAWRLYHAVGEQSFPQLFYREHAAPTGDLKV